MDFFYKTEKTRHKDKHPRQPTVKTDLDYSSRTLDQKPLASEDEKYCIPTFICEDYFVLKC